METISGPLSTPNGDERIIRGHFNEVFMCDKHNKEWDDKDHHESYDKDGQILCRMVSLREYLGKRGRLVTGKTKK